jgi:hypothetical protein
MINRKCSWLDHDEARDYRLLDLLDLPGDVAWSRRVLALGESEALIAHLDATCAWFQPSDLPGITDKFCDEYAPT